VQINTTPLDLATAGFVLCNVGFSRAILYGITVKGQKAKMSMVGGAPGKGLTFAAMTNDQGMRIASPRDRNYQPEQYADKIRKIMGWQRDDSLVIPPTQNPMETPEDAIQWVRSMIDKLAPEGSLA
jgi:hypothetical protein